MQKPFSTSPLVGWGSAGAAERCDFRGGLSRLVDELGLGLRSQQWSKLGTQRQFYGTQQHAPQRVLEARISPSVV